MAIYRLESEQVNITITEIGSTPGNFKIFVWTL
jgi:hypothetical protein